MCVCEREREKNREYSAHSTPFDEIRTYTTPQRGCIVHTPHDEGILFISFFPHKILMPTSPVVMLTMLLLLLLIAFCYSAGGSVGRFILDTYIILVGLTARVIRAMLDGELYWHGILSYKGYAGRVLYL